MLHLLLHQTAKHSAQIVMLIYGLASAANKSWH